MNTPVIQIVGYKNSGKTTLIETLTEGLTNRGFKVGTVKHDAHEFDIDHPGTDTWRHRRSGARMTAITSDHRTAIVEEKPTPLPDILQRMANMDIVLVEGFKQEPYPKIVMVRSEADYELVDRLSHVAAIVSWLPNLPQGDLPVFGIEDTHGVMEWILKGYCR